MNKKSIVLSLLLLATSQSFSQSFFEKLLNNAKEKLVGMGKDAADKLTQKAMNTIDNKTENVVSYFEAKVNNVINVGSAKQKTNQLIQQKDFDSELAKAYPAFFKAYKEELLKDTSIKNVIFGYKSDSAILTEQKKISHMGKPIYKVYKDGTIFFDLSHFDNDKPDRLLQHLETTTTDSKDAALTYFLFQSIGDIHGKKEIFKDYKERIYYSFTFAIEKSKDFALKGNCVVLKYVINELNHRMYGSRKNGNLEYADKMDKLYKECTEFSNKNCK